MESDEKPPLFTEPMINHILRVYKPTNFYYPHLNSTRELLERECKTYISREELDIILQENGFTPNKKGQYKLKPYEAYRKAKNRKPPIIPNDA